MGRARTLRAAWPQTRWDNWQLLLFMGNMSCKHRPISTTVHQALLLHPQTQASGAQLARLTQHVQPRPRRWWLGGTMASQVKGHRPTKEGKLHERLHISMQCAAGFSIRQLQGLRGCLSVLVLEGPIHGDRGRRQLE